VSYNVEDIEFLAHEDKPLLARLYVPNGPGPFRMVVELHGGVWTLNDRTHTTPVHVALAEAGIAVAALDFRQGAEGAYPLSVADAHYGIRWVKANAERFNSRADLVGLCSQSSGAHIAALIAIRPREPRYAHIALPAGSLAVDASVRCLAMFWPVVNPIGRYRYAKQLCEAADPPDWALRHVPLHDAYWRSEANMKEGSPMLALDRGEGPELPPALLIQPRNDPQHIYHDPASEDPRTDLDRFLQAYRRRAPLEVVYYDAPQYFTTQAPNSPAAKDAFRRVVDFFRAHIPVPVEVPSA
jgi:acetyl esterase/lipase